MVPNAWTLVMIQKDADDLKVYLFSRLLPAYVLLALTAHFAHDRTARYDYELSYFVGRTSNSQVCFWFPLLRYSLIVLGGRINVMN